MNRTLFFAAAIMSLGMSLIPLGDTAGKIMMQDGTSPLFVAWSRLGLGALILLPWISATALRNMVSDWRIWLRGLLQIGAITSIITALQTEPLAETFGAFFVGPFISYILSAWLLGEQISRARTILLLIGFAGVMMVVQPGTDVSPGLLWAILAGIFYGGFLTASRWLSGVAQPKLLLMTQLVIGGLVLAPFGLTNLPSFTVEMTALTLLSAISSMFANLLLVLAYRRAAASRMAPFVYVQLFSATGLGWLFFGTWPGAIALCGLVLIVLSGLAALAVRED